MVTATLDDQACSLELSADCFTVAAAASYARQELGAAWAGVCSPTCISQHGIIQFNSVLGYLRNVGKYSRTCPLPACAAGNASRGCQVLCICRPPCPARCSPSASPVSCVRPAGRARPFKKRLFLSAKGWQPGGRLLLIPACWRSVKTRMLTRPPQMSCPPPCCVAGCCSCGHSPRSMHR